jgi:outer membrane PBP1 activator LpoA protein
MQRFPAFLSLLLVVALAGCAAAPVAAPVVEVAPAAAMPAPPETPQPPTQPPVPALPTPQQPVVQAEEPVQAANAVPHLALLLPLKSNAFGGAAEAVRQGFMAAAGETTADIRIYATDDQPADILSAYRDALQQGARMVVGPLTRSAVTALAASHLVSVPTLALNQPEADEAVPPNLYLFSLSVEAEARQIARMAFADGRVNALVIGTDAPLSKRTQLAFIDEWQKLRGKIVGQIELPKSRDDYPALRETIASRPADMIFLAASAEQSRMARPYFGATVATYATSQIYPGKSAQLKTIDLNGIRFVDMPWLLQPDHPAVMAYPAAEFPSAELARLYAFGIDAFRLSRVLAANQLRAGFALDGVTGTIRLKADQLFEREPTPAEFVQGEAVILESAGP